MMVRHITIVALLGLIAAIVSCSPEGGEPAGDASGKTEVISKGEAYKESDYLVADHVVILKFTADW